MIITGSVYRIDICPVLPVVSPYWREVETLYSSNQTRRPVAFTVSFGLVDNPNPKLTFLITLDV